MSKNKTLGYLSAWGLYLIELCIIADLTAASTMSIFPLFDRSFFWTLFMIAPPMLFALYFIVVRLNQRLLKLRSDPPSATTVDSSDAAAAEG